MMNDYSVPFVDFWSSWLVMRAIHFARMLTELTAKSHPGIRYVQGERKLELPWDGGKQMYYRQTLHVMTTLKIEFRGKYIPSSGTRDLAR